MMNRLPLIPVNDPGQRAPLSTETALIFSDRARKLSWWIGAIDHSSLRFLFGIAA